MKLFYCLNLLGRLEQYFSIYSTHINLLHHYLVIKVFSLAYTTFLLNCAFINKNDSVCDSNYISRKLLIFSNCHNRSLDKVCCAEQNKWLSGVNGLQNKKDVEKLSFPSI